MKDANPFAPLDEIKNETAFDNGLDQKEWAKNKFQETGLQNPISDSKVALTNNLHSRNAEEVASISIPNVLVAAMNERHDLGVSVAAVEKQTDRHEVGKLGLAADDAATSQEILDKCGRFSNNDQTTEVSISKHALHQLKQSIGGEDLKTDLGTAVPPIALPNASFHTPQAVRQAHMCFYWHPKCRTSRCCRRFERM